MRALISGAGIAGLAAGIAVRRAGLEVEIFERSAQLQEIGAGLMIWPNGARALRSLGVEPRQLEVKKVTLSNWHGRRLTEMPVETAYRRYGAGVSFVHRADLQAALAESFGSAGLHLGSEVRGFVEQGTQIDLALRDGTVATGDLLVGADGLRSPVRRQLLGDGEPTYLGSTIWRGLTASEGMDLPLGCGINWWGRGSEFLAFHLAGDVIYWAGVTKEPQGEKPGPGGHKKDLLDRFGEWAQPVPELISATKDDAIVRNDMYDRPPAPHWSRGRVTLAGDAAHPMSPNQGQGACQALEDGVALGGSLQQTSSVVEAFQLYERRRVQRANREVTMSRQATRGVQLDNPVLCAIRDGFMSLMPRPLIVRIQDATLASDRMEVKHRG